MKGECFFSVNSRVRLGFAPYTYFSVIVRVVVVILKVKVVLGIVIFIAVAVVD